MNLKSLLTAQTLLWHSVGALTILLLPSPLIYGMPAWKLAGESMRFACGLSLAYLAAAVVVIVKTRTTTPLRMLGTVAVGLMAFGSYALFLILTKSYQDRTLFSAALALSSLFLLLPLLLPPSLQRPLIWILAFIALAGPMLGNKAQQLLSERQGKNDLPKSSARIADSAYYSIDMSFYDNILDNCDSAREHCASPRAGGAISTFGQGYLATTGDGLLYYIAQDSTGRLSNSKKLPYQVPLNSDEFVRDNGIASLPRFRVTGAVLQQKQNSFRLFVAHHYWKGTQKCFVSRVSSLEGNYQEFLSAARRPEWQTVYESEPCLKQEGGMFYGDESGGRIVLLDKHSLLLSLGDFSRDGLAGGNPLAQDQSAAYGKTIRIDVETGKGAIFSSGHRNPQGLHVDQGGTIWETEHGPRGGDELNIIVQGANYGWPFVTYGTHALSHSWPLSAKQGEHDGFRLPIYAWIPDIAVSNLIKVNGNLFDRWRDDLLIGSYTKTLSRLRIRDGRVIYAEPIEIRGKNARIRDILEDAGGRIILLLDGGSVVTMKPTADERRVPDGVAGSDSMRGQLVFTQCLSCHDVKDGSSHRIGPDLFRIVDRPIGRAENFNYSGRLSGLTGKWSAENLDKFLANPQQFAPGTSMAFGGVTNASDRAQLVDYLKGLK